MVKLTLIAVLISTISFVAALPTGTDSADVPEIKTKCGAWLYNLDCWIWKRQGIAPPPPAPEVDAPPSEETLPFAEKKHCTVIGNGVKACWRRDLQKWEVLET